MYNPLRIMALTIGAQLGSLEITSLLGKGGMGEVYRARDLKLKRDVAIKILPEEFARDSERVSRFQREAEVLASLNHPNIAGIYDLEEANNSRFLVLELVEGETLAERIARGPIAVGEALDIAKHICDALEAAHEKGIIHRDLKPANVKVTQDGRVKVLDFGLAKALIATPESPSLSNSPTMLSGTMGGMIVGTAAYMSPEQARGRAVDARADIFSFGCVLFEMLTGKHAFDGEDVAEILSRVLQREPEWTLLPADVPTGIRQVLRLCLEKDPRKRRRSAGDVRIDIEQASASLEKASVEPSSAPAVHKKNPIPWIAAAVFAITAAAIAWTHFRESAPNTPVVQFEIVSKLSGRRTNASISPDGRWLAYYELDSDSRPSLFLRNLSSMQSHAVAGSGTITNVGAPLWSPDSREVVYGGANSVMKVAAEGGSPQQIPGFSGTTVFASENRDGVVIQAAVAGIVRISATESQPIMLHPISTEGGLVTAGPPHFLPDGHHFVFSRVNNKPEFNGIFAASLDPAEKPKRLTDGIAATPARDPETGTYYLLVTRDGQVTAQRFDPSRLELSGEPQPIGLGLQVTASDNGILAIEQGNSNSAVLAWYDRSGKIVRSSPPETALGSIDLSPDGSRLAVTMGGDLWLRDLLRGSATRFTTDPAGETIALWSPPGDRIVFVSTPRSGKASLWIKPSTGAAAEEPLLSTDSPVWANDWSHDGRFLIYSQAPGQNNKMDLAVLPMDQPKENRKPISYLSGPFTKKQAQFSPDGRFVAYASDESGKFEIYVQPFPDAAGGKWPISSGGGVEPRWSKKGDELFYFSGKKLMAVAVKTAPAFSAGIPHELFEAPVEPGYTNDGHRWAIAPDGTFLLQTYPPEVSTSPITIIVNWPALLKQSKGK